MRGKLTLSAILCAATVVACSSPSDSDPPGSPDASTSSDDAAVAGSDAAASTGAQGSFRALTYNVAGLPQGISGGDPLVNTPKISPLLNQYDLVLVQEDFSYHDELAADANHPHHSVPTSGSLLEFGDGLNRFSLSPFSLFSRDAWEECNGFVGAANDCLTDKGFSFAVHDIAEGVQVHIYNLHNDAGRDSGDMDARTAQVQQLLLAISQRSDGAAVIVAGDTNMKDGDEAQLDALLGGAGLTDACRALSCPEPLRIDRVMFRSSATVDLSVSAWEVDNSFVDDDGEPLSDHEAVGVTFDYSADAP